MKKLYTSPLACVCLILACLVSFPGLSTAQCTNADFSNGNFGGGWSGTYSAGQCPAGFFLGICIGCSATNPLNSAGINSGPVNDPPTDATTEYNQVITSTAGGNDPYVTTLGISLPMVWPGGGSTYSARLGNMWQAVGTDGTGDGETISYTFVCNSSNCNFTYHYAVVLNVGDPGTHLPVEQPFFKIRMKANGTDIACADYDVNAVTAATVGGFTQLSDPVYGPVWIKPWSSVFIPLNNYIGQTVVITFTSRGCLPGGCSGSHFAYEYLAAECAPLTLVASSPTVCGGQNLTLTAPAGAATYSWTGPGIVGGANSQVVTIDQPGQYVVAMTTFGNTPCNFSLDTIMTGNPANVRANFSAPVVCQGAATTFTDESTPPGSISAWSWDFGDGTTGNTQNPTHTYAAAGTYHVTLTVTSTPCTKDTVIDVTVSPPPTSTFTAVSPVCEGSASAIVYTGNGLPGDTYTWNFGGGVATPGTGQGPQSVTWATGGTKTVTLTVSAGACSSPQSTQQVVVNPFPGMTLTPYTAICAGNSATLTAGGATTYAWAADPSLSATNTATVTATPASTTTYTVSGTSANCVSIDTVTVAVFPVPTSPFTAPGPVCAGANATVTYTGNAGPNATYNWGFAGGNATPASGQGPFQVNWAASGNWSITLTVSQYGCTSTQTSVPITVNPSPTSTFTATSPLCTSQNGTITFTGSASGAAVYTWGFAGANIVSGTAGTAGPYTVNWTAAGTHNVTLSVLDNGCSSPLTTVPVIVNPIPTALFTATTPLCVGQNGTITFTGTATGTAVYTWGFAGGNVVSGSGSGPYTVNWGAGSVGPQMLSLSINDQGCIATPDSVPITIFPNPTSTFTATGPVCTGQTSTVTYTGTADNLGTYTWSFSGGVAVPGTGQGPQSVTWATAGTQNITLQVTENGCSSPVTTVPVIVNPIPTANFTATSPLCVGANGTVTYTGSSTPTAVYAWNFSGANIVSGNTATSGPFTVNWGAASVGTQTLSLAITDQGCVGTPVSVPVTINAIPVTTPGNDTTTCAGNSVLIGGASVAGYTYAWLPVNGLSDPTSANPTVSLSNTSSNSVVTQLYTVTTSSQGCSSSGSVTVTINPQPVAQFVAPQPQCLTGNSFTFKSVGSNLGSAVYAWSFGGSATPAVAVTPTASVAYGAPGTFATVLAVTQVGCSATATDSVTVFPMPQIAFGPDTVIGCENFEVCFNNTSLGVTPMTYQWHFGDGESSSAGSPCHLYVAPGVYSVYLKITSSQQCSYDTTVLNLIKVIADPIAKFTPSATLIQQPESQIDFTNQSLNSVRYLWDFNSEGVSNAEVGNSTDVNPRYNFAQYGLYSVKLLSYNALGCVDSVIETITVLPPQSFFIPNAFTPNGDGKNDLFYIEMQEGVTVHSFQIFNRWGEKVHDGLYPWDGIYKGKQSPEGVYVYVAKLRLIDMHEDIERKGSVTLIR